MENFLDSNPDEKIRFLVTVPTDKMDICKEVEIDQNIVCKVCQITVIVSLSGLSSLGAPSEYNEYSIELFLKDFETQTFINKDSQLIVKNVMVERFDQKSCHSCNIKKSEDLIFRFCEDENCTIPLEQEARVDKDKPCWFFLAYESPFYTYNREIQVVEIYLTKESQSAETLVYNGYNGTSFDIGTVKGRKVI